MVYFIQFVHFHTIEYLIFHNVHRSMCCLIITKVIIVRVTLLYIFA